MVSYVAYFQDDMMEYGNLFKKYTKYSENELLNNL